MHSSVPSRLAAWRRRSPRTRSRRCASRCSCLIVSCVSNYANRAFYRCFRIGPVEVIGKLIYEVNNRQWDIPSLRILLDEILPQRTTIEDFLVEHEFEHVGFRSMLLNARRIEDPLHKTERILLAMEDITERKESGRSEGQTLPRSWNRRMTPSSVKTFSAS